MIAQLLARYAIADINVEAALTTIARYLAVLEDGAVAELRADTDHAVLSYRVVDAGALPATQVLDLGLAVLFRWTGTLAGPDWRPREVCAARRSPVDTSPFAQVFGTLPRFAAAEHALVLAAADLERPLASADPHLRRFMERDLARNLARLPAADDWAEAVRSVLAARLHRGPPDLEEIAGELGVSRRTLQRRLREQRVDFRRLRDEVRHRLAVGYLREPGRSVAEVALLLGYGEVSAFHHAFRRWTGASPGAWQRDVAGAKSQPPGTC